MSIKKRSSSNYQKTSDTKAEFERRVESDRSLVYLRKKIYDQIKIWAKWTSIHGVSIIFRASNLPLKLFWLIIFFSSFGLCCLMLNKSLSEYYQYKVSTVIRTNPTKKLRFPLVTICDSNFFASKEANQYIRDYFLAKKNITVRNYTDLLNAYPNADDLFSDLEGIEFDAFFKGIENSTFAKSLSKSKDEFFYKIQLGSKDIKADDKSIEWYFDSMWGNCFRINYQLGLNPAFDIKNVNTGLYFEVYKGLPESNILSDINGFRFEIKPHDGYPNIFDSFRLDVGTFTNIIVSARKSKSLPKPYSSCVDIDKFSSPVYSIMKQLNFTYSRERCLDFNFQYSLSQQYGCYLFRYIAIPGVPQCNITMANQIDLNQLIFANNSQFCPLECESFKYYLSLSRDAFPTKNYAKLMINTNSTQIKDMRRFLGTNANITVDMIKRSFASVNIKFDNLAITETIEKEAISFVDLISNLGGIVGLFIAVGFLSIMELFELGIISAMIIYQIKVSKNSN